MEHKKIFLLIDDDIDDRDFFIEAVMDIDPSAECLVANDGKEALDKLRNEINPLPDVILLDMNMPGMDGKTCLAELKKDHRLKDIPVIMFTTSDSQNDIDVTRELGAAYFLTKPSDFQKLRKEIIYIMNSHWPQQTGR